MEGSDVKIGFKQASEKTKEKRSLSEMDKNSTNLIFIILTHLQEIAVHTASV